MHQYLLFFNLSYYHLLLMTFLLSVWASNAAWTPFKCFGHWESNRSSSTSLRRLVTISRSGFLPYLGSLLSLSRSYRRLQFIKWLFCLSRFSQRFNKVFKFYFLIFFLVCFIWVLSVLKCSSVLKCLCVIKCSCVLRCILWAVREFDPTAVVFQRN